MSEKFTPVERAILDVLRYGPKSRTALMNGLSEDHAQVHISLAITRLMYANKIQPTPDHSAWELVDVQP